MNIKSCSFSSDRKLSRCEMQFHYRYGERIIPKVKKIGLYRGDWIHKLLQAHYETGDWKKHFRLMVKKMWKPLFDEEKEYYGADFPDTVEELLAHYVDHWSGWEGSWEILHVEQRHELPTKFGFPVRWQSDLIVRDKSRRNRTILVETKAKKSIPDSSERILQPQVHSYAFLLSKVGIKIDEILWNYIRTEPVPRPKILKSGALSERQINTDQRGYMKSLQDAGIHPDGSDEWIGIQNKIDSLPVTLSLERISNTVNLKMGEQFVRDWIERHRRAQAIKRPLRSWNRNCKWDCDYYDICQVDMVNKVDRKLVLIDGYEARKDDKDEKLK